MKSRAAVVMRFDVRKQPLGTLIGGECTIVIRCKRCGKPGARLKRPTRTNNECVSHLLEFRQTALGQTTAHYQQIHCWNGN